MKEATARIKINKLLEAAGWRFFAGEEGPANICLEPSVAINASNLESLGDNFDKTTKGFIDFLLLDTKGFLQFLLFNNKYQRLFSPTDFDLVISDEAHRSIGGNARAVFDYFVGYKLGLTATPRDYLKKFDQTKPSSRDPREAERMFPGKYQSDFAVQVTSQIEGAQQFTINFTNNNLLGSANFLPTYRTSKARVCVTVGMMTTGYDCPDILNLGLFRPIFSPTDFIQIKGRGTRKHQFLDQLFDENLKSEVAQPDKTAYKLFDFFATCEYFETEFKYDEVLKLPTARDAGKTKGDDVEPVPIRSFEHEGEDFVKTLREEHIGLEGMKIDRMFFEKFEDTVRENEFIAKSVEAGQWDRVIDYVNKEVFDKPEEFYTLEKLRKAAGVDRRLTLREILAKIFGLIPRFKSKDELLEEEFAKFVADHKPEEGISAIKIYFKAYLTSSQVRDIIESKQFTDLATNPVFSVRDFKAVPAKYRAIVPEYIKDYVSLNQFAA